MPSEKSGRASNAEQGIEITVNAALANPATVMLDYLWVPGTFTRN